MDTLKINSVHNEVASAYASLVKIKSELDAMDPKYNSDLEDLVDYALKNYNKRYISLLEFLDQLRSYANARIGLIDLNTNYFKAIQYMNYTTGTTLVK